MLMEQKNLKTSVFSLDTVFCESAEQGIDIDFTLFPLDPPRNAHRFCKAENAL